MATYDPATYEQEIERHFKWNFVVNSLDGAFFWFAMTFASTSTILPVYVSRLTDSPLLIGLVQTIPGFGWLVPQLFTAPLVERMSRKKPYFIWVSLAGERAAFLAMALGAFSLSTTAPGLALIVFYVALIWHAFGAGMIATAWQEMVAKIIPLRWRGRFFGVANSLGAAMGVPGSLAATAILSRYEFPTNFALCFAITFVGVIISWICVALTREPHGPARQGSEPVTAFIGRLGQILRTDSNFAHFLYTRIVGALGGMFFGFVTVYAVRRFGLPDSVAGVFTTCMVVGQLVGNLALGPIADRRGHKLVIEIGALCNIGALILILAAPSPAATYIVFGLLGINMASYLMSGMSITFEFSEPEVRPTYIGLASTIVGLFSGLSPILGGWLAGVVGYVWLFAICLIILLASWAMLHWWVVDPRFAAPDAQPRSLLVS